MGFGRQTQNGTVRRGISPVLFYSTVVVLAGLNVATGTAFYLSGDLTRLMNSQTSHVIGAYEDRLAQMRVEVDRLYSRTYAQAGDMNMQLQELSQQQDVLLEQHQLVRALVDKADQLGIAGAAIDAAPTPLAMTTNATGNPDIAATSEALAQMMDETETAMSSIESEARSRSNSILVELARLGMAPDLPAASDTILAGLNGVGGPLLPARDGVADAGMLADANAVMAALVRYKAARDSLATVPVSMPITGDFRQSSSFGNRRDPFTGGRAFHAGLDFAAATGTTVLAAGAGVVTFVGNRSGYGKLVEVTHENGLVTRYGHLSGFIAHEGQVVSALTPIARVGSTGRSTGPHLHFEVRRADEAIDPKPFLDAGKRLAAVLE